MKTKRTGIVLLIVVVATLGLVAAAPIQFHNLLSSTHLDTVSYSPPVTGDLIAGNSSGKWERVPPNVSTTPMVLGMTGDGTNGASPQWVPLPSVGPTIVARRALVSQVGPYSTILFTPSIDGDFLVTMYMSTTPPMTGCSPVGGCIASEIKITDERSIVITPTNVSISPSSCSAAFPFACTAHAMGNFHAGAGTQITVDPTLNFADNVDPYDLYIVLEEL